MSALFWMLAIAVIGLLWWLARPDKNERILMREYELLDQADQRARDLKKPEGVKFLRGQQSAQ